MPQNPPMFIHFFLTLRAAFKCVERRAAIVEKLMHRRMFPLTLQGLEGAMRLLSR